MSDAEYSSLSDHAFRVLGEYERQSLIHSPGRPEQVQVQSAFSGIVFRLRDALLASPIPAILEILEPMDLTRVPGSRQWLLGIANVRGNLVPIIDFGMFLDGRPSEITRFTRILIISQQGGNVGLLVDEVQGQRHFSEDERSSGDHFAEHPAARYIGQNFSRGEEAWGVFDIDKLTAEAAFQQAAV